MAEGATSPRAARAWPVTLVVLGCVGLELMVAGSPAGPGARVTALSGLAGAAVALSLRQALGGLVGSRALRAAVVAPLLFSLVLTVVLMLDAHVRGGNLVR